LKNEVLKAEKIWEFGETINRRSKAAQDETCDKRVQRNWEGHTKRKRPTKHPAAFGSGGENEFAKDTNAYAHVDREAYLPARERRTHSRE
jgi:hypothetical protein